MNSDTEFLHEFFAGAEENLDQLEHTLIGLETQGAGVVGVSTVAGLSTLLQELKNGAGFLGLAKFFTLAEAGEPLLAALAAGDVPLTTPVVDGLLQLTETLKDLLVRSKGQADDREVATDGLCTRLALLAAGEGVEATPVVTLAEEPLVLTDEVMEPVVEALPEAVSVPVETIGEVAASPAGATAMPAEDGVAAFGAVVDVSVAVKIGPLLRRESGKPAAWQAATLERRLQPERRGNERRTGTRRGTSNGAAA